MLDLDKYECYNLPHVTTCPGFPYQQDVDGMSKRKEKTFEDQQHARLLLLRLLSLVLVK